jgi:PTS system fructose-specific IIA component/PTS system nitrogen regulatory IIA component
VSPSGIEFESLDGDPVQLFFLLVSPPDRPGDHLRALESISRQLRDESFCKLLKSAKGPVEIQHLLEEADSQGVVS